MSAHNHNYMNELVCEEEMWNDETAEWYAEEYGDHFSTTLAVDLAHLRADDIVLDIGCGSGTSCRAAASVVKKGRVIGIDPTPGMLRIAQERSTDDANSDRMEFMAGDAESVPLDDASVTVALAVNSLHHWEDLHAGLSEVKRVLQSRGRFFIADELNDDGTTHGEGPLADPVQIERLLADAGFGSVSRTDHVRGDERMCFFSALRP